MHHYEKSLEECRTKMKQAELRKAAALKAGDEEGADCWAFEASEQQRTIDALEQNLADPDWY